MICSALVKPPAILPSSHAFFHVSQERRASGNRSLYLHHHRRQPLCSILWIRFYWLLFVFLPWLGQRQSECLLWSRLLLHSHIRHHQRAHPLRPCHTNVGLCLICRTVSLLLSCEIAPFSPVKQPLPDVCLHRLDAFGLRVSPAAAATLPHASVFCSSPLLTLTIDQGVSKRSSEFVPEFSSHRRLLENQRRVAARLKQRRSSRNHVDKCFAILVRFVAYPSV